MTPFEIEIMLHYNSRVDDPDNSDVQLFKSAVTWMLHEGLLSVESRRPNASYGITERGLTYVSSLQDLPLPVQVWVIPQAEKPIDKLGQI